MLRASLLAALLALSSLCVARAQPPAAGEGDAGVEPEENVARDSPRASMRDFLTLCEAEDYEGAATYLELTPPERPRGAVLAKRLKAVLDRKAWLELESLSPEPGGNALDGLPTNTDELGRIQTDEGTLEPVRIVRRRRDGVRWMFSNATVGRIDGWYERLDDRWILEHMPAPLLQTGPRQLMWWQWLTLPMLLGLSWLCAMALSLATSKLFGKIASRSAYEWDDVLVQRLKQPLTLWWTLGVAYILLPLLSLYAPAEKFVLSGMRAAFLVGFFWALARVVDIWAQVIFRSSWAVTSDGSRSLVLLGARVAKVAVLAIGAVALLSQLGYPVASILAGLGVGGLAVALAAQKTVENLFGAFSIGADQPFREGDTVRVDNFVATVEQIGLRSTKFRTPERTIISIPNGKLADMRLETFATRDRLRFNMILSVVLTTSAEQLRSLMERVELRLKREPKLAADSASVRLEKLGPASFDIDVSAYFETRDWGEFRAIREEVLLSIVAIVEDVGSAMALPTQVVQLAPPPPTPSEPTRPS